MKAKVVDFENKEIEEINLDESIFAVTPSESILNLVVNWQRSKRQAGTHQTKEIGDVSGTTRKPHKQKGTGKARLGSLRAAQCRGGGIIFGPHTRSHAFDLPKKVRKLGLRMALSAKLAEGKLKIVSDINFDCKKTKELKNKISPLYTNSVLIIDSFESELNTNFSRCVKNMHKVDLLWQIGANVYDILNHNDLIITKNAVKMLEDRLK